MAFLLLGINSIQYNFGLPIGYNLPIEIEFQYPGENLLKLRISVLHLKDSINLSNYYSSIN
jgi:hypothetical protein